MTQLQWGGFCGRLIVAPTMLKVLQILIKTHSTTVGAIFSARRSPNRVTTRFGEEKSGSGGEALLAALRKSIPAF